MAEKEGSLSGLSADEAKEFHSLFMTSFGIFTAIAIVAHILVWMWRPWLPGDEGYASLIDTAGSIAPALASTMANMPFLA